MPFEQPSLRPNEYQGPQRSAPEATDSVTVHHLLNDYHRAVEEYSRWQENLPPTATVDEIQKRGKTIGQKEDKITEAYDRCRDKNLRKEILDSLLPKFIEFTAALVDVDYFPNLYQNFIRRIQANLNPDEPGNIEWVRDENGRIQPEKLNEKIRAAARATTFVGTMVAASALNALEERKCIDILNEPDGIERWKSVVQTFSSFSQITFLRRSVLFENPDIKPDALIKWIELTSWIDTEEKKQLATALQLDKKAERMAEWNILISDICKPIPLIQPDGTIRMGASPSLVKEILEAVSERTNVARAIPADLEWIWKMILAGRADKP